MLFGDALKLHLVCNYGYLNNAVKCISGNTISCILMHLYALFDLSINRVIANAHATCKNRNYYLQVILVTIYFCRFPMNYNAIKHEHCNWDHLAHIS